MPRPEPTWVYHFTRVEHLAGVVFGMASGHDDGIAGEQARAFTVQLAVTSSLASEPTADGSHSAATSCRSRLNPERG